MTPQQIIDKLNTLIADLRYYTNSGTFPDPTTDPAGYKAAVAAVTAIMNQITALMTPENTKVIEDTCGTNGWNGALPSYTALVDALQTWPQGFAGGSYGSQVATIEFMNEATTNIDYFMTHTNH